MGKYKYFTLNESTVVQGQENEEKTRLMSFTFLLIDIS